MRWFFGGITKAKGTRNDAVVEFTGQVQRIAKVYQYGLRDRPSVRAKKCSIQRALLWG
jgi:hypothetical protein